MGDKVLLTVQERDVLGKKVKQLRKQGLVPGIVYGHDVPSQAVMAPANVTAKVWHAAGKHRPVELTVGTKKRLAMIKSVDIDPVKHQLRHVSLHVIKQNEKVEAEIPLKLEGEGETQAEKAGYVVLQALETVDVEALPANLPEFMYVPGEKLAEPGDTLTVADIKPIDGVVIQADPEIVVTTVYEPSALAAQNDAAGGDATDETEVEAENGEEGEETAQEAGEEGKVPKGEVGGSQEAKKE